MYLYNRLHETGEKSEVILKHQIFTNMESHFSSILCKFFEVITEERQMIEGVSL